MENTDIISKQLESIKNAWNWANPDELKLEETSKQYEELNIKGISKEELARKIIDKRNIHDGKDYFSDQEQIQKANSYAEFMIKDQADDITEAQGDHDQEMKDRHAKEIKEKEEMIKKLTEKLNDTGEKNTKLEKNLDTLKRRAARGRQRTKENIDNLTKSTDQEEITKLKAELTKIRQEKAELEKGIWGNLEYKDNINTEKITSKMLRMGVKETDQWGRKKVVGFETMPLRMTRRRMTINTVAKMINEIKDNPTTGVDFVMAFSKTRFTRYFRMTEKMDRRDILRKVNIGRNVETFRGKYEKQKTKIMTVLTGGIKIESLPPEEQPALKAIEARIDYYANKYMQNSYAKARQKPQEENK